MRCPCLPNQQLPQNSRREPSRINCPNNETKAEFQINRRRGMSRRRMSTWISKPLTNRRPLLSPIKPKKVTATPTPVTCSQNPESQAGMPSRASSHQRQPMMSSQMAVAPSWVWEPLWHRKRMGIVTKDRKKKKILRDCRNTLKSLRVWEMIKRWLMRIGLWISWRKWMERCCRYSKLLRLVLPSSSRLLIDLLFRTVMVMVTVRRLMKAIKLRRKRTNEARKM